MDGGSDKAKRNFTVDSSSVGHGPGFGTYKSVSPTNAAKKAATKLFKDEKTVKSKKIKISFSLRETTRTSAHKVFYYTAEHIKSKKPKSIDFTDKDGNVSTITVKFETKVYKDRTK